jgi:hypothetical protein
MGERGATGGMHHCSSSSSSSSSPIAPSVVPGSHLYIALLALSPPWHPLTQVISQAISAASKPLTLPSPSSSSAAAPASPFTGVVPAVGLYAEGDSVVLVGLKTGFGSRAYHPDKASAAAKAGGWHRFLGWWAEGQQHGPGILLVRGSSASPPLAGACVCG